MGKNFRRTQIAPFFILLIILILSMGVFLFRTGKFGSYKLNLINACDSAVLAGASELGRKLNHLSQIHWQMLINYMWMQVYLLARSPWPFKMAPYLDPTLILRYYQAHEAYDTAKEVTKAAAENAKTATWSTLMGSVAIDEKKVLFRSETTTFITEDEYQTWLMQDTPFADVSHVVKDEHPLKTLSSFQYYWGRDEYAVGSRTADFPIRAAAAAGDYYFSSDYDYYMAGFSGDRPVSKISSGQYSSLQTNNLFRGVELSVSNVSGIDVSAVPIVMIYFYWAVTPKGVPIILPGFIPLPWAWLSLDSSDHRISCDAKMVMPTLRFPSGENPAKKITFTASAEAEATGSLTDGFDLRLVR